MRFSTTAFATIALSTLLAAQNTNEKAPIATHTLAYTSGAKLTISYKAFTIAKGKTLRALSSGKSDRMDFYNNIYIPMMLDGHITLNAAVTIGGEELEKGKYRFSFSIDKDAIWNLDVYTDTGKKTIGDDPYAPEEGWWQQETKVASITLDSEDDGSDKASRLSVQPVAGAEGTVGNLKIHFGPITAKVEYELEKPEKTVEASSKKKR